MVLNAAAGAGLGLTLAGTLGGFGASGGRESAFRRALETRGREQAEIGGRRTQLRQQFGQGLLGVGEQQQAAQIQALQGLAALSQPGGGFEQGTQQGLQDIAGAGVGLTPQSAAFGAQTGPGAGVQSRIQAQQQPLLSARNQLSATGLGQISAGRQRGDILRQQQLGLTGAEAGLQRLQGTNVLGSAGIGLEDLKSQLRFQAATQQAQSKGGVLDAFSGLAQGVGGGLLAGGFAS